MSFTDTLKVESVEVFPIRASGGVSPNMVLGQMPTRPALLVRLMDAEGCYGWGEIWANFPPRANLHKAHVVEDVVAPALKGFGFTTPGEVIGFLRERFSIYFLHVGQQQVFEHILAGLDVALWDLALRNAGQSLASNLGMDCRAANTYASSINPPDLEGMVQSHAGMGETGFKLKLGFNDDLDRDFIRQAAGVLPAGTRMMVDTNQAWCMSRAKNMLGYLEQFDPVFSEEPIPANSDYADWEALAESTSVPLAAGENIYGVEEFLRMADAGVQYLQPDVAKWGGVTGAMELIRSLPHGVSLWPHFMGTAVGQMAALAITSLGGDQSTCEMDVNANPLRTDLCGDVLTIHDGCVDLPGGPGLAVSPVADQLQAFQEPAFHNGKLN